MPRLTRENVSTLLDKEMCLKNERNESLARKSGIPLHAIFNIRRRGQKPHQKTIDRLNRALGYLPLPDPQKPLYGPKDAKKRYFIISLDESNTGLVYGETLEFKSIDELRKEVNEIVDNDSLSDANAFEDYYLLIEGRELTVREETKIIIE